MSGLERAVCRGTAVGALLPDLTSEAQAEAASAGGQGRYTVFRGGQASQRSWALDLAAARSLCISCPALAACRDLTQEVPVSGVAAGLTEEERAEAGWLPPDDDADRARLAMGEQRWLDLLGRAAEQWPYRRTEGLPQGVLDAVHDMKTAGLSDSEVVDRLAPLLGGDIQVTTIGYLMRVRAGRKVPALPVVAS